MSYEQFRSAKKNTICDIECRDEGMLVGLHQMGNHGPAYYKRYPEAFKKFTLQCETSQIENCSVEEINNADDNAILYTDLFLEKVIELLRDNEQYFDATMLYVSDHGESLGESGLYLHGMPYFIVPDAQTHVPMSIWSSVGVTELEAKRDKLLSHDNLFHTVLGMMHVQTKVYESTLDIMSITKK